ncbi:hypothetical protein, partial [Limnohabitans sp. Rim8]|uniref:hypothetical protein n=1 Tax=Limnohabitans sp. Rim8 TaxID=1100718 RepID=UPI0025D652C3
DDGSGVIFSGVIQPPVLGSSQTPAEEPVATTPVADPAVQTLADDDRPVTVNDVTVNEGSPFAVFTVGGKEGQYVQLDLQPTGSGTGHATLGADTATALEFWNGNAWTAYTPGTFVQIPADGDGTPNEAANLLVRVAIQPDTLSDNGETYTLTASNTGGASDTGLGTITDDGTGTVFDTAPNPATANAPATPGTRPTATTPVVDPAVQTVADDDRPVTVNNVEVNEATPFIVWTVGAKQGQYVQLDLASTGSGAGHATLGTDTGTALEYWSDNAWTPYTPGTLVKVPGNNPLADGQLLVRVAVKQDNPYEGREPLNLKASNAGGAFALGEGAIRDDGEGQLFGPDNRTATPDAPAALSLTALDDDRVAVPAPQQLAPAPASVEVAVAPATSPALHVQEAVAEGRQAVSVTAPGSSAGLVTSRAISGVGEGRNELHRTDVLIDKFERVTDPHLYVLPQVKDTRGQAFDAASPSYALQSGLLADELMLSGSKSGVLRLSQSALADPALAGQTLADQTLAALTAQPATDEAVQQAAADGTDNLGNMGEAQTLAQKQALHLAASRAALAAEPADAQPAQALARGQFGFSQQLQMSAAKRGTQSNAQSHTPSHTPWARPLA